MIGLTAGLAIEGQTGKSIPTQVKLGNTSFYMCLSLGHMHETYMSSSKHMLIHVGILAYTLK